MFRARLTRPEQHNKYYIPKASGGFGRQRKGSPDDAGYRNVSYACGRFHEIAEDPSMSLLDPVHAGNLYQNARAHGLATGQKPRAGALIVWQKGTALLSGGRGYAAVVEQVHADGSIVTSESCGKDLPFRTVVRRNTDGNWNGGDGCLFLGFVYQPDDRPKLTLRKGDDGDAVIRMQVKLWARGYLPKTEVDGVFGKITLGALLAFQLESGLEPDGICGPLTTAALFG